MGICGEFYRVEDEVIDFYVQNPEESFDFFAENYSFIHGKYHNEPDRHFDANVAWDVAIFLLQSCDPTANKVVSKIKGQRFDPENWTPSYIKSYLVKEIADALEVISDFQLQSAYTRLKSASEQDKTLIEKIYRLEGVLQQNWDYVLSNTKAIISAFAAAKRYRDGIVIHFC